MKKEYNDKYYKKHRPEILKKRKRKYKVSQEEIKKRAEAYYEAHREKILTRRREVREKMKQRHGTEINLNGEVVTMWGISELARRLGREAQTIRLWERNGVIPRAMFRSATNRRLYTEEQVEAVVRIAKEENLLVSTDFAETKFTERVFKEFERLSKEMERRKKNEPRKTGKESKSKK